MNSTTRKILKWWHIIFGVVAVFFAIQYLRDGFGDAGANADRVKGFVWVALALFMIVPEFIRRRRQERH